MQGDESKPLSFDRLEQVGVIQNDLCESRHVAAIDIGSNSVHLVIANVNPILNTFTIESADKSTTRLGEVEDGSGELTEYAMGRGLETLRRFKDLALSHNVEEIIIAATSAVREAPNGLSFVQKVKQELDLDIEMISGLEEGRLIYLGVLSGMPFGDQPHILVDIGGGSTELILADAQDCKALTSTKIGAVRLHRDFIRDEVFTKKKREFLKAYIQGSFEPSVEKILKRIKPDEVPSMIATSGTALAIGSLIASDDLNYINKLSGFSISKNNLDVEIEKLINMSPEERKNLSQLKNKRSEIIIPGGLILQTVMKMFSMNKLTLSERALREGLIVDWMLRKGLLEDRFSFQKSIRQRTVLHQVTRFAVDLRRSERVASNALTLYEKCKGLLHQDKGYGGELLWAAAMLHSCGQHINISAYHKHSWYLIRHGELLGYSQSEHLIIAAIARYHRRSLPKKRHEAWQSLKEKEDRKIVSEMSLLLRLAASLDRRPVPVISGLEVDIKLNRIQIKLIPESANLELGLEIWSMQSCAQLVKDLTGADLEVLAS